MTVPLWVTETAESFWVAAGGPEPFPRNLRRAIARSLPLTIILLPQLNVRAVEEWLRLQGAYHRVGVQNRSLRACLVSRFGHGIVFVDGVDSETEQRFSVAHELSHFLRDYQLSRQRVAQRLGTPALEVLDGLRPVRTDERAIGLLAQVDVRAHVHLMDRMDEGSARSAVNAAESDADGLAFELLAPWETVSREIQEFGLFQNRQAVLRLLMERYGLPLDPAVEYLQLLIPDEPAPSSLLRHLRASAVPVELSRGCPE